MVRALLVAVALALAVVVGVVPVQPVAAVPASAPPTEFSAMRARQALEVIAARPHPTGIAANDAVRDFLVQTLEGLGFETEVEDATSLSESFAARWGVPVLAAHVRNVLARRRGREGGPGLMLMAHYDSRELAPGASDDGFGTATLLETARALASAPPLRHDVLLLFTEGEEIGLLGAKVFLEESPAARDVGVVLNFEARGDKGPVFMFQSSQGTGGLIDVMARVSPYVTASSLSQEIYRRMPNDTDLTPWLRAGYPAMNFANVDGFGRYHQPTDTVANADLTTLQHHGSYALTLTRALADADSITQPQVGDRVYFSFGTLFVHYAAREATTLAGLAVGLLGIAIGVATWRGRVHLGALLAGAGVTPLAVLASALVARGAWWAADHASAGALASQQVRDAVRKTCVASIVVVGAGVAWGVFALARRRVRTDHLALGALLWWSVLAVATALVLPGGSYLFVWPLMTAAVGWCARVALPTLHGSHAGAIAIHLLAAMVAIVLFLPMALQLGVAFGPQAAVALASMGALASTAAIVAMKTFGSPRRWVVPMLLVGAGLAGMLVSALVPAFDVSAPRPDSLVYVLDADHRAAAWVSFDDASDSWTGHALADAERTAMPALSPRARDPVLHAAAPLTTIDPPRIGVLADTRQGATRSLRLRVTFPPGTEAVELEVPPDAHVTAADVQGKRFGTEPGDGWLDLAFFGPPAAGLDLSLEALSPGPIALHLIAQTRGLPADLTAPFGPRPPDRMPAVVQWSALCASDMTLVTTSFEL